MNAAKLLAATVVSGVLLLSGGQSSPAYADVLVDDFEDGVVDASRWVAMSSSATYGVGLGPGGAIAESGGRLVVTTNASGSPPFDTGFVQANALCYVAGNFDVQVDFEMLGTPDAQHSIGLVLQSGAAFTFATLSRAGPSAGSYQRFVYPSSFSAAVTSDLTGKLRFARTSAVVQGYYWNTTTGWVALGPAAAWSTAPSGFALRISTSSAGAASASVAFDNLVVSGGTITCPQPAGSFNVSFTHSFSSYAPGANADQTATMTSSIPTEATGSAATLWPPGFGVDFDAIPVGAVVGTITSNSGDFLCTGASIPLPTSQLQKRPALGSELLRIRTTVLTYAADYLMTSDPVTGGYRFTTEESTAADGAPIGNSVPGCPPYSESNTVLGVVNGTPVLTNPMAPGLYPFISLSRGRVSGTEYIRQTCVAIGGTVGVEFTDADGDCLLDVAPSVTAGSIGRRLAAPPLTPLDPNPANPDTDGDGVPDGGEASLLGSSPTLADTDSDGSGDLEEARRDSDPNLTNSDGDAQLDADDNCPGVANSSQENTDGDDRGDACDTDDDNDGMLDDWEAQYPACVNTLVNDASSDADGDGMIAFLEFGQETSPCAADTDGDSIGDYTETFAGVGTSPIKADTDGDGVPDGYEVTHACLNAIVSDGGADPDADGVSNIAEYAGGTNPCVSNLPPSIGGIAEQPDVATLPSAGNSRRHYTAVALGATLAGIVAAAGVVGWRRRRA